MRWSTAWIVLLFLLAGCLEETETPQPTQQAPEPEKRLGSAWEDPPERRGHVHDYWDNKDHKVLLDGPLPLTIAHVHLLDEPPREQHSHGCDESLTSESQGGTTKFGLPPGNIVPPGTRSLEVEAAWDVAAVTGVRLMYRPPMQEQPHYGDDHHHLLEDYQDAGRIENGGSVEIPIELNMTDLGHDFQSRWAFFLCADNEGDPAVAQGEVGVTIIAHRIEGELPLDAPHPYHWEKSNRLPLGEIIWNGESLSALKHAEKGWHRFTFHHGAIVPPFTRHVEVLAWLNGTSDTQSAAPIDLLLYYRDATEADWVYETVQASNGGDGSLRFTIQVADNDMTDSYYSHVSHWDIWLRIVSKERVETPADLGTWGAPASYQGSLEAHAYVMGG